MKASEWYSRGLSSTDSIDAMTNFWRAFNNQYSSSEGRDERIRIKEFLKANIFSDQAKGVIEKYPAEIEYLISRPIVDMRGNGRDTMGDIENYRLSSEPVEKLISLFMMIYQVRCNLEHGQKSPNRDRDIELCRCAAAIVSEVLG